MAVTKMLLCYNQSHYEDASQNLFESAEDGRSDMVSMLFTQLCKYWPNLRGPTVLRF